MGNRPPVEFTESEKQEIRVKITQGAAYRARALSIAFSIGFFLFAFTSIDNIRRYAPDVTLWQNLWPRLAFNSIPALILAYLLKDWKTKPLRVMWYWNIGFPAIFVTACNIHVWPTILKGHPNLYLYVHGANVIVLLMALILVSQKPSDLIATLVALTIFFIGPLIFIFNKIGDLETLTFLLNDMGFAFGLGSFAAYKSYQLRLKLAQEDVLTRRRVSKFVGSRVTQSVFEDRSELLKSYTTEAFVMVIDFRGFTTLSLSTAKPVREAFMAQYHQMVAKVIHSHQGHIHKTAGDGYIISFGLMEPQADLTGIPGLELEEQEARMHRHRDIANHAVNSFRDLCAEFHVLQEKHPVAAKLKIGGALDFGQLECKLIGDPDVRLEFDIDGVPIFRCSRLETYTKYLINTYNIQSSLIAVSQFAAQFLSLTSQYRLHRTEGNPVRDFPEMSEIHYVVEESLLPPKKLTA